MIPPRLPAVQRVIDGLFGEMIGDRPVDRAAARRVMRAASQEDRRFIAHLLGWRDRVVEIDLSY